VNNCRPKALLPPTRLEMMPSPLEAPPKRSPGVKAPLFFPKASASMIALPAVLVAASVAALTPPVAVRLEVLVLPSSQMVLLPVRSVIPIFPAPSALPAPAEMMFQVWPPLLLFAIASQVPKLFAVPTVNGV